MVNPVRSLDEPRQFLLEMFHTALDEVHPDRLMEVNLPDPPAGRTIVIGAGKAAAAMAKALERRWYAPLEGLVVTRYGHGCETDHIEVVEASHPVPDAPGISAARRIMALAQGAGENDLVIVLISGGASALLAAPLPGITLEQKQEVNRALLRCGAPIAEMNCVRRHLSAIKGGKLAHMIDPARSVTLVISDVPGDDPAVVGSGPTVAGRESPDEALEILNRYGIEVSAPVIETIRHQPRMAHIDPSNHSLKMLGSARTMLRAAATYASHKGVTPLILGDDFQGEAAILGRFHGSIARQVAREDTQPELPCVLLSGGEAAVAVRGEGRGGRNGQFLLSLALDLKGMPNCWAIACDSDGIDGTEHNAGGLITPDTLQRALQSGLDSSALEKNNDSFRFLECLGDLVVTGPTRTNVNDFRALVVYPAIPSRPSDSQ